MQRYRRFLGDLEMGVLFLYLMASFGVTFGIQHRISFLQSWSRSNIIGAKCVRKLLTCPYCLGYWVGCAMWNVIYLIQDSPLIGDGAEDHRVTLILGVFVWGQATAVFCYVMQLCVDCLERFGGQDG